MAMAKLKSTKLKRNTLVAYHGGGYDGCIWEWNYAFIDDEGEFHSIYNSGSMGCETKEDLQNKVDHARPENKDLYNVNSPKAMATFAREHPVDAVLGAGHWFADNFPKIKFSIKCDCCDTMIEVTQASGQNPRCSGGVTMHNSKAVCETCECSGSCGYCGNFMGLDEIDVESHYCESCHERQYQPHHPGFPFTRPSDE
jgi:hypothetical protein